MSYEKEHLAFWRGFDLAIQIINNNLKLANYDFTGCTNSRQVCSLIQKEIKDEIKQYKSGDHKYGTVE